MGGLGILGILGILGAMMAPTWTLMTVSDDGALRRRWEGGWAAAGNAGFTGNRWTGTNEPEQLRSWNESCGSDWERDGAMARWRGRSDGWNAEQLEVGLFCQDQDGGCEEEVDVLLYLWECGSDGIFSDEATEAPSVRRWWLHPRLCLMNLQQLPVSAGWLTDEANG